MKWSEFIGHQHTHTQILLIFKTDRPQHKISKYKHSQKTTGAWTILTYCPHDKNGICQSELHYNFFRNFLTIAQSQRFPYVTFMVSREEKETCSSTMSTGCWCWKAKRFNEQKNRCKIASKARTNTSEMVRLNIKICDFNILLQTISNRNAYLLFKCVQSWGIWRFELKLRIQSNGKMIVLVKWQNILAQMISEFNSIWKFDSSVCLSYKGSSI